MPNKDTQSLVSGTISKPSAQKTNVDAGVNSVSQSINKVTNNPTTEPSKTEPSTLTQDSSANLPNKDTQFLVSGTISKPSAQKTNVDAGKDLVLEAANEVIKPTKKKIRFADEPNLVEIREILHRLDIQTVITEHPNLENSLDRITKSTVSSRAKAVTTSETLISPSNTPKSIPKNTNKGGPRQI